jgi:hypothetical protein
MKKSLKNIVAGLIVFAAIFTLQIGLGSSAHAAGCNTKFLSVPAWYDGLTNADCSIKSPTDAGGLPKFITILAFNIVDILLNVVGYLALFFVLYGGFQFLTSGGNSDAAAKARNTILNALIGAVISFGAMGIVNEITGVTNAASDPQSLIKGILNAAYQLAAVVAVIVIIISGFKLIVGGDNPNTVSNAKTNITYAIIGLIVVLLAFSITSYVLGKL